MLRRLTCNTAVRATARLSVAAAFLLLSTALSFAQVETGQITGVVLDQTGKAIIGAALKATNIGTDASREAKSNSGGLYSFPNLSPGTYEVTVTAPGFATTKQHIELSVGQRLGNDFHLEVGATNTMVEVSETATRVNTETQAVSSTISERLVTELPSLTLNPYDFVATVPNVSPTDPSGRGVGFSINGLRAAGTNVMLDGVANNDEFTASTGQQVPLDSVQEYSITTGGFTAELGRASAGVVNLVTKSGTNVYHGSLYEFNRLSALGSNSFFNNANDIDKGIYTRNQFGYSIGGPVIKNKLFFFQNTEWTRVRSAAPQVSLVPTPQFIAAASPNTQAFFSSYGKLRPDLTTLATITKSQLGSACTGTGSAANPCGSLASNFPIFNEVTYNTAADAGGGLPQNTYDIVGNVDYNLSEKTQISAKYALYSENDLAGSVNTSPYAGYETGQTNFDNHITISLTHTFTPNLISQTRLSYNRLTNVQPLASAPVGPTLYMSANGEISLLGQAVAFPGYSEFSPGNAIPFGGPQNFAVLTQDWTRIWGKHSFRFGGQFTYIQDDRTFGAYEEAVEGLGTSNSSDLNNFLLGQVHEFEAAVNPQGKFPGQTVTLPVGAPSFSRSNRYKEGALYVQDSWKLTPRLTVNAGVRWEYFGVQHNVNSSLDSNFYPGAGGITSPAGIASGVVDTVPNSPNKTLWNPQWGNFAPRLGLAWDIFGDGKTSLRAGYGIGYERNFGNVTFNIIQNPPNYAVLGIVAGTAGFPTIPLTTNNAGPLAGTSGSVVLPAVTLRAVDPNIKTAYAHQYNASIEHQFAGNLIWSETYSGSAGENLYSINYDNLVGMGNAYGGVACTPGVFGDPGTCTARLNTQYGSINGRANGGISNYNALISRVIARNFSKTGITIDANYTWSRAIDNLSDTFSSSGNAFVLGYQNPFNPIGDRGDANFDIRHRVSISGIWDIPLLKGSSMVDRIFGGWELAPIFTAHSGSPFSLYDCSNGYNFCERAETSGAIPQTGVTNVPSPGLADNYQYYTFPKAITSQVGVWYNPKTGISDFGPYPTNQLGRDVIRTPGTWNLNLGVYKNVRITERVRMQLRLELYNAFNHANFIVNTGDADVSAAPAVDGLYNGNRNLQLGMKIVF